MLRSCIIERQSLSPSTQSNAVIGSRRRHGSNRLYQHLGAGRIVRDVEDESSDAVEIARNLHVGEMTRRLRPRTRRSAHRRRRAASSEKARFARLVAAGERRSKRQSLAAPFDVARRPAGVDHDTIERTSSATFAPSTRPPASRAPREGRECAGSRSPITAGRPGLKMPAFSPRDLLERRSEILGVIEADRRDAGDDGIEHVRRIESSAEPRFDDARRRRRARAK